MKGLPRYATGRVFWRVREPETESSRTLWRQPAGTDICDFALYAYRFPIDKDVRIHNIFVAGKEKMDFYVRNNPDLPGCATWMHHGTEQGNQYLNADDINHCIPNGRRIYRYWKCRYLLQTSDTDERFSHFTEEERLY